MDHFAHVTPVFCVGKILKNNFNIVKLHLTIQDMMSNKLNRKEMTQIKFRKKMHLYQMKTRLKLFSEELDQKNDIFKQDLQMVLHVDTLYDNK